MVPRPTALLLSPLLLACATASPEAAAAGPAPATILQAAPAEGTKLLRFPDLHGDRVVFCHGGDLWLCTNQGGLARRLTAHPGLELFPKFSPDGRWIAFTGQYDGDEQVYVISADGGEPRRLTHYPARGPLPQRWGFDNQVYGWTSDGKVLFRSMREGWDLTDTRLYTVSLQGELPKALPMPVSGGGDLSPDGKRVVYSPLTRDFRTWKRYEGGWAQDLFIFDIASHALEPVAHHVRTERDPMWIGDRIVFASDRDGTLNLYSFDLASKSVDKLTSSTAWDVRWPSKGDGEQVIFELGGELEILDLRTRQQRHLTITVPDDGLHTRPTRVDASGLVESFGVSPRGERIVVAARGEVFSVPVEKGPTRNLTRTPNAHDREVDWSPDGRQIVFLSDRSGEEELWLVPQDGQGEAKQLTEGGAARRFGPRFSPDGKWVAFSDKSGRLLICDIEKRQVKELARDRGGNLGDYTWSPDSRWLAFSLANETTFRSVHVTSVESGEDHVVTPVLWNCAEPTWSPDGKYLWFFSDREYAPQISDAEWNFATSRTTGIFALALKKDTAHPFPPQSDEVKIEAPSESTASAPDKASSAKSEEKPAADKPASGAADSGAKKPSPVQIDFDGIAERVARAPIPADNLRSLTANAGHLFYISGGPFYYGRESDRKPVLHVFSIEKRESAALVEGCSGYVLSSTGEKLLAREEGGLALYDASSAGKGSRKGISLGSVASDRDPKAEWQQIYHEVWRRYRDYFYVENMHGYDWKALGERYAALLPHVAHRTDLNYVMGELVAELNVSHAYVSGGDWQVPRRADVALLGCEFELDAAAGRYKIGRILPGQNEEERYRSPLREIGVDVKQGEYLLAINGEELRGDDNPYRLLRHKAGAAVELRVGATPDPKAARTVKVRPITSESELRYLDFVLRNRERVEKLSGGRLAYIHIPDMGEDGIREFIKWYYGQIRKDGLIIDDRNNGGGNVSQMILERMRRTLLGMDFNRNSDWAAPYPEKVFTGPMVCLLNENSASDGDIFPWMFRNAKLGPLIGKRSWGGVVGISDHGQLMDGGSVNVPEFGYANAAGQWDVEGHGVDPDIVVENDARSLLDGRDPQLERAVEECLKLAAAKPAKIPTRPQAPVKTK